MNTHLENRAWAFEALDELETFLGDEDFERDPEEERATLQRKRKELKEGKYRVVFVGTFNVGKSTLINAFLGDDYLPTVLEECTTKIIHVMRAEELRTVINLTENVSGEEVQALEELLRAYDTKAKVELHDEQQEIAISYAYASASSVRQTLDALTTMRADEDYPKMRTLRSKFEELFVYVPTDTLEEDIALVDSPGAHSIDETNQHIAQEIIPHSHLVVCMLDSQNAGNEQNRKFIENVVGQRRRKMFFLINKADQLNENEIDVTARRGPARDLVRCLQDVVANPELFFVSSLYGLLSARLTKKKLTLADIDGDNKIRIPYEVRRALDDAEEPETEAAKYLYEKSYLDNFRTRLFDYLYTENREGAIVQSICCFLDSLAWKFARPLEVKLDMVRHIPRLDEIARERDELSQRLDKLTKTAEAVTNDYKLASAGGEQHGRKFPGYEGLVDSHLNHASVERLFLAPLREWILKDENWQSAEKSGFKQLTRSLEKRLEAYLGQIQSDINTQVRGVENRTLESAAEVAPEMEPIEQPVVACSCGEVGEVSMGLGGSYFGFAVVGAVAGAGVLAGAAALFFANAGTREMALSLVERLPDLGGALGEPTVRSFAALGGIGGAVLGSVFGVIVRLGTAGGARRSKMIQGFSERVSQRLLTGYKDGVGKQIASVREQLIDSLAERREGFGAAVGKEMDAVLTDVNGHIHALKLEEERLKEEQAATISRLEPKIGQLKGLAETARQIANVDRPSQKNKSEETLG